MDHPALQACLSRRLRIRGISAEDIVGPEAADFLEDLGNIWNDRNKDIAASSLRGALTGFATGGYPGAVLGAVGGGYSASRPAPAPKGVEPTLASAASLPQGPDSGARPPALPNASAVQVLAAVFRPEFVDAFTKMAIGKGGLPTISVAGTHVPVSAFADMLQQLISRAAARHHELRGGEAGSGAWTEYLEDIGAARPEDHANALLDLLSEAAEEDEEWDEDVAFSEAEYDQHFEEWLDNWPWTR